MPNASSSCHKTWRYSIGDCLIITPLVRYLDEQGWEIYLNTSEEGAEIFKYSPRIKKIIPHVRDSIPIEGLHDHWEKMRKEYNIDRIFNLTESIEVSIVCHPSQAVYMMPKQDRIKRCSRDEYEYTFEYVGINPAYIKNPKTGLYDPRPDRIDLSPELHFTREEENKMALWMRRYDGDFKIYHPVSGSGLSKIYPYWQYILDDVYKVHKDIVLITVGDTVCELIDHAYEISSPYVVPMSAKWSIRESMLASKYCDLIIGTDTGMMHAAGAWDVTKVLLLGHNDANTISRHFKGKVVPIQSTVNCSPCHRLIYNSQIQCPRYEPIGAGCICMTGIWKNGKMTAGIDPWKLRSTLLEEIKEIKNEKAKSNSKKVTKARKGKEED